MLRYDKPEGTQEVRQEENDADNSEHLEAFSQVDLVHNFIIVSHTVVTNIASTVLLKHSFQVFTVAVANQSRESLGVEQDQNFRQTEHSQ